MKKRTTLRQDILPNVKRTLRGQAEKGVLRDVGMTSSMQKLWAIQRRKDQATSAQAEVELRSRP